MASVLVFGTFDILHKGHLYFLEQAKKYGNLSVVVARDLTVKKIKGQMPINNELTRKKNIEKLKIGKVVLGNLGDPYKIIEDIKPDIICLGYDQNSFTADLEKELEKRKIKAKIIRLKPYKADMYKSSKIKKNL